jgi:hypothetical protein
MNKGKKWYRDGYEQKKTFTYKIYQKGIRGSKDLELALTSLLLYKKLCPYIELGGFGNSSRNLARARFDAVVREMDGCHSIVSTDWIIRKVDGMLGLKNSLRKKKDALRFAFRAKMPADRRVEYENDLKEAVRILQGELHDTLDEQKELIRLYIEYMSIGNPSQKVFIEDICERYKINLHGEDENE